MKLEFFKCNKCGNVIVFAKSSGVPVICCGEPMTKLIANTNDGAAEKHVPTYKFVGNEIQIQVGSELHPMEKDHHISFICIETEHGFQYKTMWDWKEPVAKFCIPADRSVKAIYEYCNKHGLWKTEIK